MLRRVSAGPETQDLWRLILTEHMRSLGLPAWCYNALRSRPDHTASSSAAVLRIAVGISRPGAGGEAVPWRCGLLLEVVEFDRDAAREAGAIRAELAARGTPIGPFDVLMAGQARGGGLTLVDR